MEPTHERTQILQDPVDEGRRLAELADAAGLPLRLLGGVAVRLHSHRTLPAGMQREMADIDLAGARRDRKAIIELLREGGYEPDERFNAINGASRLVVYDVQSGRHIDVFLGEFRMCHRLDLEQRLTVDRLTIPLAELLLSKLQVVELNRKDVLDVAAVLLDHDIGAGDRETVNADHVTGLLAADWGWWRTATQTIAKIRAHLPTLALPAEDEGVIDSRLSRLLAAIEDRPKSRKWRARARLGERVRWYEEPEEISHSEAVGAGA